MRLQVRFISDGLHPSEAIVEVPAIERAEELVVHRVSIVDGAIEIGYPVATRRGQYCVELPAETATGAWRVWVSDVHVN